MNGSSNHSYLETTPSDGAAPKEKHTMIELHLPRVGHKLGVGAGLATIALGVTGIVGLPTAGATAPRADKIVAVGAENEYANVISQIGGKYVTVSAIMSNPNTDPHEFEASPSVAQVVSAAQIVVQNGVGYDTFMDKIESASPDPRRKVVDVQKLLGLPDSTPNPHLWYSPKTMPAVARVVAADLSSFDPTARSYFDANVTKFDASLEPWLAAIAKIKATYPGVGVATTEPVGDYMLTAAGTDNKTPWSLQADIMNGVDPSPQDVTLQEHLFSAHEVRVFLYNQQVTDSLTETFLADAKSAGVPVVGVYETMPTPGYTYQSWMLAEVDALGKALSTKQSTEKL
jgi:zinc/manganese transport system substrate-binding protein